MSNKTSFTPFPHGAAQHELDPAEPASFETSVELVSNNDFDAFYFRALEAAGTYLNRPQIEAVRHLEGPALVLAGAGSGKTRVLTSRAAYLISVQKVNPKNILLVTFTKKAAEEIKERMISFPGLSRQLVYDLTTGTFHSIFYRLLKSQGFHQKVLNSDKQKQIAVKMILKRRGLQDAYEPETLLSILSSFKNNMKTVEDMPSIRPVEKEVKAILKDYESWKQSYDYLDFDDMLLEAYFLLRKNTKLLTSMKQRFPFILCDEWQDTNPIQYELMKMIAKPSNHLFVVGDDDQTIFSFNGADSSIILNFARDFLNAKTITLDVNYRSTANIVTLANQVIKHNQKRHEKTLKANKHADQKPVYLRPDTTDEEASLIIEQVIKDVESGKWKYKDMAILHRTATSSRAMFDQLVLKDIPFVTFTRGETFYEQGIVKPVLDYLRLSMNPQNVAAISSILPSFYLSRDKTMQFIETQELINPEGQPLNQLLNLPRLKDFQRKQISKRLAIVRRLHSMTPMSAIKEIRKFYDKYLEADDRKTITIDKEMITETLAELEASSKKFDTVKSYLQFVDDIIDKNNQMARRKKDSDADVVTLMTIHRSKGLEYPVIYWIGASETILPHSSSLEADQRKDLLLPGEGRQKVDFALEEERRLAYVAITRAQQELFISSPSMYRGKPVAISRFLMKAYGTTTVRPKQGVQVQQGRKSKPQRDAKMVKGLVWECTSSVCFVWKRKDANEKTEDQRKKCPLCKSDMVLTEREIKTYT
ncbi:DNA helicase UvrD [Salipaludibacillus keqinensis]|uniref:DNA 3'-5' helicase n=1 Tax=Salipaludibacillus keqinensis TaxID=2045207 RepID=A0A323TR57_9BACI|nr:UvrD-helicase domain-containing protein [Salipaludibacillus keqinensis]PYZ95013.1 DNA helicase UvrD [Salipaludibacillus keqinensis]